MLFILLSLLLPQLLNLLFMLCPLWNLLLTRTFNWLFNNLFKDFLRIRERFVGRDRLLQWLLW